MKRLDWESIGITSIVLGWVFIVVVFFLATSSKG